MESELQGDESNHLQACQSRLRTPRWNEPENKFKQLLKPVTRSAHLLHHAYTLSTPPTAAPLTLLTWTRFNGCSCLGIDLPKKVDEALI